MVVVRESVGANKQDDILVPSGKAVAKLPDGREVEIQAEWWDFIGDMHIRFVFDQPQTMIGAMPEDFERLGLANVDQALELALANVRRVYGEPAVSPWAAGVMAVHGQSPDLDSSYVLDRDFWRMQLKEHPDGLVVAVPARGGLLYAPLSDHAAVDGLKKGIGALHASSGRLRVSRALYLFKADKWSVFQPSTAR